MGRQLNFWMTQSDECAFADRLRLDDAVWTPRTLEYLAEPALHELNVWRPVDSGQRIIIIRRSDWHLLKWKHIPKSQFPDNPAFTPWTMVGTGPSPCFEWDACTRGQDFIARGRIYYSSDWLEADRVLVKPDEPTRWFERLKSWLRRRGTKWGSSGQFLMPGAASAVQEGSLKMAYFDV